MDLGDESVDFVVEYSKFVDAADDEAGEGDDFAPDNDPVAVCSLGPVSAGRRNGK
jgi:hypothetical protein